MFKKSHIKVALFVPVFFVIACSMHHTNSLLDVSDSGQWRTGDLMLRCGYGAESRVVTTQSQSTYSHIGILYWNEKDSIWMIIHAVPGENEPEYIKYEPVEEYFSSHRAKDGAWMRVDCEDSIAKKAAEYTYHKWKEKIVFDNSYLLSDSTQLYCTELVWRAYMQQGIDISNGKRHTIPQVFSKDGICIFPSDIEQSETTLFVKPFKTKTL